MERLSVNAQKRPKQSSKGKKRASSIKVTYISSPMRVRTSKSEFRAVVQELTGQGSDVAGSMAEYMMVAEHGDGPPLALRADQKEEIFAGEMHKEGMVDIHGPCSFEMCDEGFAVPGLDNLLPCLMPPLHLYGSQNSALRSLE